MRRWRRFLRPTETDRRRWNHSNRALCTYLKLKSVISRLSWERPLSFLQVGRLEEAIAAYREAANLDPKNAQAQKGMGWGLMETGRY